MRQEELENVGSARHGRSLSPPARRRPRALLPATFIENDSQIIQNAGVYKRASTSELRAAWIPTLLLASENECVQNIARSTDEVAAYETGAPEKEVSNACKYDYAPECEDEVRIELARASATHFRLSVEDDGGGMPRDGLIKGTGFGTKLIRAMASSMQAEISFDPATAGARATLNAPY